MAEEASANDRGVGHAPLPEAPSGQKEEYPPTTRHIVATIDGPGCTPEEESDDEDPPAPTRFREVAADDLRSLGRDLAASYGRQMRRGLQRAQDYYTRLPPITATEAQWRGLAEHARAGAQRCCPSASVFFDGLQSGLGWDVYEALLDFEVYTLELQRQARAPRCSSGSSTSGSAGASASGSSSAGGTLSELGLGPTPPGDADKETEAEPTGHCTGFAVVDGQRACIIAQTVDLPHVLYGFGDFDCILRLKSPVCSALVYDSDGRLCPIGFSSAGLGVSVFNLHQTQTTGFEQPSLTVQSVVWELLLGQHSIASAKAWLQSLAVPLMCGSALLLADSTGAVSVELNPGGPPSFGEVHCRKPISRANHPLTEAGAEAYGGTERAHLESATRLRRLEARLAKCGPEAGPQPVFGGADALKVLRGSSKVRNSSTLACLAMDLRHGLLHADFRERQRTLPPEVLKLTDALDLPLDKVERALSAGSIKCETGRRRLGTGKPEKHFVRWAAHVYALRDEQ